MWFESVVGIRMKMWHLLLYLQDFLTEKVLIVCQHVCWFCSEFTMIITLQHPAVVSPDPDTSHNMMNNHLRSLIVTEDKYPNCQWTDSSCQLFQVFISEHIVFPGSSITTLRWCAVWVRTEGLCRALVQNIKSSFDKALKLIGNKQLNSTMDSTATPSVVCSIPFHATTPSSSIHFNTV